MLKTIPNPHNSYIKQQHTVIIPVLCPVSLNPVQGSKLIISYTADAYVLDILTLPGYVKSFYSSEVVRDLEQLVQRVAVDVAQLVKVTANVVGVFVLTDGQELRCELSAHGIELG